MTTTEPSQVSIRDFADDFALTLRDVLSLDTLAAGVTEEIDALYRSALTHMGEGRSSAVFVGRHHGCCF